MLLFVDESGTDHKEAPYEVLAGVAISERHLWSLIQDIRRAERTFFHVGLSDMGVELKGKSLLKRKTFRFAQQGAESIQPDLARQFLEKGTLLREGVASPSPTRDEFTAYGQAILGFVRAMFELCGAYRAKFFASIVDPGAPRPSGGDFLRKDYAYLFERFFYYLEDLSTSEMGIVVFDELEKAQCRILLDQMARYFLRTEKGKLRSARILPEPFFVHSDLTTAIQVADIAAYCLNWGLRLAPMTKPVREELRPYAQQVFDLRYVGKRMNEKDGREWPVYGIVYIDDLRPKGERGESEPV